MPLDYACYAANACTHFIGNVPVRAHATGSICKYNTINRMYGMIEYARGRTGIVESSKKSMFSQELQISCSDGILTLPISWTIRGDIAITLTRSPAWAQLETVKYRLLCKFTSPGLSVLRRTSSNHLSSTLVERIRLRCPGGNA